MSYIYGNPVQLAFVVPDLQKEMQRYISAGVGPFFEMKEINPPARYRGERHDPVITAVFGYSGDTQIELIQQHDDTPSAYKEYLDRQPNGGFHHVAFTCSTDSFDDALRTAGGLGKTMTIVQEYLGADGNPVEIYLEPEGETDPLLIQLNLPNVYDDLFAQMKEASRHWSGEDPVRDALALLPGGGAPKTSPARVS